MPHSAAPLTDRDSAERLVIYEQPLIERMRTFLRLEFLFQQSAYHAQSDTSWGTRAAIAALVDILAILTRGDVRSEVLKELERQSSALEQYESRPGVDHTRLERLLERILFLREQLNSGGGQLTQRINECEFLSGIKHRSAIPGGTCKFDLPDYSHWLTRPYARRSSDLDSWLGSLQPLSDAVTELLWLTRESAGPRQETAAMGLFKYTRDKSDGYQLVRVALPRDSNVFPEISGSQQRFTIRFLHWHDIDQRPTQTSADVNFILTCC